MKDSADGLCDYMRFGSTQQCKNPGEYGNPDLGSVMRETRWCEEHKHYDDRLMVEEDGCRTTVI